MPFADDDYQQRLLLALQENSFPPTVPAANVLDDGPQALPVEKPIYVDKSTSTSDCLPVPTSMSHGAIARTSPPRRRARRSQQIHHCPTCQRPFTRAGDLERHRRDVHSLGDRRYECHAGPGCYSSRRCDKMKEHCQKRHGQARGYERYFETPV